MRDGDKSHYMGKGVLQAVANWRPYCSEVEGMDAATSGCWIRP